MGTNTKMNKVWNTISNQKFRNLNFQMYWKCFLNIINDYYIMPQNQETNFVLFKWSEKSSIIQLLEKNVGIPKTFIGEF